MLRLLFCTSFAFSAPAFAEEPAPGTIPEAGAEGAEHGEGHKAEHHVDYTGDADHDGVPNWRDGDFPEHVTGNLGLHAVNLALLLVVLFFALRRPVTDALTTRAHDIRREITDSARERDEAQKRHDELVARLSAFEDELKAMKATAETDAKAEEQKLIARAHEEAARLRDIAERNIREEVTRAQVTLRREAVDLAVKLAEQTLRHEVQADDQQRLAKELLESLNREPGAGGNGNG